MPSKENELLKFSSLFGWVDNFYRSPLFDPYVTWVNLIRSQGCVCLRKIT